LDEAFASLTQLGIGGLVVPADSFLDNRREQIAALSARYRIPAILTVREFALAGGLMSYGPSLPDSYRRAAVYVGRILKGDKPADLPVMQPEKYDLVINLKTAKALGLTVPDKLLATADEVIE
jgi:putative ABC transport system substrate-binding protein